MALREFYGGGSVLTSGNGPVGPTSWHSHLVLMVDCDSYTARFGGFRRNVA